MSNNRVYTCLKCAHAISDAEQHALKFKMSCPKCKSANEFGPGAFIDDFQGYTLAEASRQRAQKRQVSKA